MMTCSANMQAAGVDRVKQLQSWLLELIMEFNVSAVFMSNRGSDDALVCPFDNILRDNNFKPQSERDTTAHRISTFRLVHKFHVAFSGKILMFAQHLL